MKKLAILLAVLLIAGMFVTFVSCGTHMAETGNETNDNTEQESPAQPEDDDKDSENNSALYAISYNLLAATSADTVQNGLTLTDSARLKEQMAFILAEKADIVFLNEAAAFQDEQLPSLAANMGYACLRVSDFADGPQQYPSYGNADLYSARFCNYILYKNNRFRLTEQGAFAISDTPDLLHSVFSAMTDSDFRNLEGRPRMAVWGRLQDRTTGQSVIALCAHLPWLENGSDAAHTNFNLAGQEILFLQAKALKEKWPQDTFFIGGDLNAENVQTACGNIFTTVNDGSLKSHEATAALDHILYAGASLSSPALLKGDLGWSDHQPVAAHFNLNA